MKTLILGLTLLIAQVSAANAYVMVNPASMEFGGVKIGSSATQTFFLENLGNQDVRVFGCSVDGSFQCNLNCFGILYHGQSCTGTMTFRPTSEQYMYDTASISMDLDHATISVHGSGIR